MLKQRLITALILLPLVLGVLFFAPPQIFNILLFSVMSYAAFEWAKLIQYHELWQWGGYSLSVALGLVLIAYLPFLWVAAVTLLVWCMLTVLVVGYPRNSQILKHKIFAPAVGFFLIVPCWYALAVLRRADLGPNLILIVLLITWVADSVAYFTGKWFGVKKLLPNVSPKKTWAGLIGGLVGVVILAIISGVALNIEIDEWLMWSLLFLVCAIFSVIGDLTISMFKRCNGVKDSGTILPGHGGLLDRIDSLLSTAPLFVFLLIVLNIK